MRPVERYLTWVLQAHRGGYLSPDSSIWGGKGLFNSISLTPCFILFSCFFYQIIGYRFGRHAVVQ